MLMFVVNVPQPLQINVDLPLILERAERGVGKKFAGAGRSI